MPPAHSGPRLLLHWSPDFGRADVSTLHAVEFHVPEGTDALELLFRFTPTKSEKNREVKQAIEAAVEKYVDGVPTRYSSQLASLGRDMAAHFHEFASRNLLNVILYDSQARFVGRWDLNERADPPPVFISPAFSSPGFSKTRIEPGSWTVVLEVWEILTPAVYAKLSISATALPDTQTAKAATGAGTSRGKRPGPVRRVKPDGVLFGEMHAHTVHSDGRHTVAELAEKAEALGLDFVCVTDHNTTSAIADFVDGPVTLIPGEELTSFFGHFCLYGISEAVDWHDSRGNVTLEEGIRRARARGALAGLAHPNAIGRPVCVGCRYAGTVPDDCFDLVELWSGPWAHYFPSIVKSIALWDELWDRGLNVVGVAGRDWHHSGQEDTGKLRFPVTAVLCTERTPEAILESILAGKVYLTLGPAIEVAARVGRKAAGIGEQVPAGPEERVEIETTVTGVEPLSGIVRLVKDGRTECDRILDRVRQDSFSVTATGPGRYRVELWSREEQELLAITNHILVGKR